MVDWAGDQPRKARPLPPGAPARAQRPVRRPAPDARLSGSLQSESPGPGAARAVDIPPARPDEVTQPQPPAIPRRVADRPTEKRPPVRDRSLPSRPLPSRPAPRGRRVGIGIGRTVLVLASVLALGGTGYAWTTLQTAQDGLVTADVLDKGHNSATNAKPPDGSMDILLVGMDSRTDAKGNPLPPAELAGLHAGDDSGELDTDTMMLIHIPTGGGQAIGISIPRDSWVKIPGYGTGKINSAYGLAKNTATRSLKAGGLTDPAQLDVQSNEAGAREAIQTVEQLTGIGVDHYAAINLMGFYQISNAIGGVPVCLNQAVNDSKYSGAVFPAGEFSVQGLQALEFVRQRHNLPGASTDLEREQRQQAFLASMAHKVLSSGVLTSPSTLNSLITAIQGSVTIDNQWNLIDFAQEMSGMTSGNIKFQTIPVENIAYYPQGKNGVSAVEVSPAQVAAFVHGATAVPTTGTTNTASTPTTTPANRAAAVNSNAGLTVDVTNASGTSNLAATVESLLAGDGFTEGATGNTTHRTTSVVFYPAGQEANAQAVATALGGHFTLEQGTTSVSSGHVLVELGRDYKAPSGASANAVTSGGTKTAPTTAPTTAPAAPPTGSTQPITDAGSGPPCVN